MTELYYYGNLFFKSTEKYCRKGLILYLTICPSHRVAGASLTSLANKEQKRQWDASIPDQIVSKHFCKIQEIAAVIVFVTGTLGVSLTVRSQASSAVCLTRSTGPQQHVWESKGIQAGQGGQCSAFLQHRL